MAVSLKRVVDRCPTPSKSNLKKGGNPLTNIARGRKFSTTKWKVQAIGTPNTESTPDMDQAPENPSLEEIEKTPRIPPHFERTPKFTPGWPCTAFKRFESLPELPPMTPPVFSLYTP
ncbi:uncharacterized protein LOC100905861 [Galendromus occidentalis]|uniref:Uncharacterized protein LOC100905861 n=1 Tax=Galendromus occidentalis TaxID=34638 RepID=A0AAJ6QRG2_9ACAR|nr:uncharacterized protein LOC100905861 [Galendromus occidentalis]